MEVLFYGSGAIGGTLHLGTQFKFYKCNFNEIIRYDYGSFNTQKTIV
jgi:hypothetical protein